MRPEYSLQYLRVPPSLLAKNDVIDIFGYGWRVKNITMRTFAGKLVGAVQVTYGKDEMLLVIPETQYIEAERWSY